MSDAQVLSSALCQTLRVRLLGRQPYAPTLERMRAFTDGRDDDSVDELWLLEHEPVFTQGQAGKAEHLLDPGEIPVVQVDRGGQVTYHGPGQLVAYLLLDIRRKKIGVRDLVTRIEQSIVAALATFGIDAYARADAPGVYVAGDKIASLGLRIRKGRSYHGLALNVDMDLAPWQRINPCGYPGLKMAQVVQLAPDVSMGVAQKELKEQLVKQLGYNQVSVSQQWG